MGGANPFQMPENDSPSFKTKKTGEKQNVKQWKSMQKISKKICKRDEL